MIFSIYIFTKIMYLWDTPSRNLKVLGHIILRKQNTGKHLIQKL